MKPRALLCSALLGLRAAAAICSPRPHHPTPASALAAPALPGAIAPDARGVAQVWITCVNACPRQGSPN